MKKLFSNKRIVMSAIALVLVGVLFAGATFSWSEGGNKGSVNGSDITISTGSNLIMRNDKNEVTNSIQIPACTLEETSSSDGRNFFFPMGDNTSSKTSEMTFREGIAADEGYRYVSVDFQLEAGDNATDVYLGAGTIVQCKNTKLLNALRMSFYLNDGTTPTVFKPNQMPGVTMKYSPITTITTAGVPTTTETVTKPYGDYYYKGDAESTPLFHLEKNETKNITLALWLEGTEFSGNDIANIPLSIYIDFATTVDDLVKYNFVDNCRNRDFATRNHWVSNNMTYENVKYDTMMYIYDVSAERYYAMEKTYNGGETAPSTWTAYVPDTIKNFYFRRYSIDINEWWNEWEPDMTDIKLDPNDEHTYVAIAGEAVGSGIHLDGCYGYWKDADDTIRVYFKKNVNWNNLKCYAWRSDGSFATDKWKVGEPADEVGTDAWPGKILNFSHNDEDDGKPVYYIDLTGASEIAGIQFNNSVNSAQYEINESEYFFNGFATWYSSADSNGKWVYVKEKDSLIYPFNDPTPANN